MNLFDQSKVEFSPDRRYRFWLQRTWDPELPVLNYLMLNPSRADEDDNDQTVERCQRRARKLGYGSIVVTNLFAIVSTDPKVMLAAADPIGPENDAAILRAAELASVIVCAWGNDGLHRGRGAEVRQALRAAGHGAKLRYLWLNGSGEPTHPLYLSYSLALQEWP